MQTGSEYIREGSGAPVVMLHSSMSSKEQWSRLSTGLNCDFHTIAIDLYGYGEGDYPQNPSSFSLVDEALRIDTIITELIGTEHFHLVGHSYGGATALRFAYDNQERLESLSLYEPVAFHLLGENDPALAEILQLVDSINRCIEEKDFSQATRMFVDFWSGEGSYNGIGEAKRNHLDGLIPKVALDFQAGINEPLTIKDYKQIDLPVCLITSPQSPLPTRQIVASLEEALPQSQLHSTDGGHMAPITNAEGVNRVLEKFLRNGGRPRKFKGCQR